MRPLFLIGETVSLPLTVEDVNLDWLNAALGESRTGVSVGSIDDRKVIPGTATKILLRVSYGSNVEGGPPRDICVKGGFNEALRAFVAYGNVLEANFYRHLAARLTAPLPRCWYACAEPERAQGIIILDNLETLGATFPDPLRPWHPDRVARALDSLASIHGQTWNAEPAIYPWLRIGTWIREVATTLLSEEHWNKIFSSPTAPVLPAALQDRGRASRALFEMWRLDDQSPHRCVCHSDAHMGNTYLAANGDVGFLDWQGVALAPHMDDVSNIIGGSMTIADRRANERDLLRHYLSALAGKGGPRLGFDDAWLNYRRYHMHGILWAVTPASMQSDDKVLAMAERHMAAIVDHDVVALLTS